MIEPAEGPLSRKADASQHGELRKRLQRKMAQRAGTAGPESDVDDSEESAALDHVQSLAAACSLAGKVTPHTWVPSVGFSEVRYPCRV